VFERPHHQRIEQVLRALDPALMRDNACWFGGGTAIALMHGEYRESVDMDFLVSDISHYRNLRQLLTGPEGVNGILRSGMLPLVQSREVRADQYGIRTVLVVDGKPIKFEIVLEGRIRLGVPSPGDEVCGIATLSALDMATSKLLANSDRWGDDGVFNRDLIDLAMMKPPLGLLRKAVAKAEGAYGKSVLLDLAKAVQRAKTRHDWLERCMLVMAVNVPKALLWKNIQSLERILR
jgi:hypothetical protein